MKPYPTNDSPKAELFFTDIDGTLLRSDGTITARLREALQQAAQKGCRIIPASGRPLDGVLMVLKANGLFFPGMLIIAYNGSLVYDWDNRRPLLEYTVPMKTAALIIDAADRRGIHIQTYSEHAIVCRREDEEIRRYRSEVPLPLITAEDPLSVLSRAPYKLLAAHLTDKQALLSLQAEVTSLVGENITAQFSNDRYLEFFDRRAGKGNAVRWVHEYLHIPLSQGVAAGDAPNDLSLLQAAGIGVAMANAEPAVKAAADLVTARTNDQDGLLDVLEEFFL